MTAEAIDETILHPGGVPERRQRHGPLGATAGRGRRLHRQQQLGGRPKPQRVRRWDGGQRSAHCLRLALLLVPGAPGRRAGTTWPAPDTRGRPGIIFGRNLRVAWGITNNISSQRDLYQERTDPAHPGAFLYDGQWEPARERVESIAGARRGRARGSRSGRPRNGPIVDDDLAGIRARHRTGVAALGRERCPARGPRRCCSGTWPAPAPSSRTPCVGWVSPTLSMVLADVDGGFGYRATGQVPLRSRVERGYRRGWDPRRRLARA